MRNITTQFELFENEGIKLQKVTIECESTNPDYESEFTVYGIGRDKREAAIFALATAWMIHIGEIGDSDLTGEKSVSSLGDASSFIESYTNLEDDVRAAISNELDPDYFGDHGTESDVYLHWEEIDSDISKEVFKGSNMLKRFGKPYSVGEIGGYVVSMSSEERSDDDEEEDEDY